MAAQKRHIVVIGAGVTGLTSAVFLAEAGYKVTIIAAHVPGDSSIEYTSPWAGAHWRTHATVDEPVQCDWDVQTYNYWIERTREEDEDLSLPRSGVKLVDTIDSWDVPVRGIRKELWWAPYVQDFEQLSTFKDPIASMNKRTPREAPIIQTAIAYKAMCVNVPKYLLYLQDKAKAMGAEVVKARLPVEKGFEHSLRTIDGIIKASKVDCYVNATGLGAAKLCQDEAMYPIRGQTVLVKGEAAATQTRIGDGYSAYCIPRPGSGMSILGGTKQVGEWSEAVDPNTTRLILERCGYIVPELQTGKDGGFEVVSVQCGLRPGRKGGPRMEKETLGGNKIVHAYGHAGAGYQNSIGSARLVVQLVGESLSTSAKL